MMETLPMEIVALPTVYLFLLPLCVDLLLGYVMSLNIVTTMDSALLILLHLTQLFADLLNHFVMLQNIVLDQLALVLQIHLCQMELLVLIKPIAPLLATAPKVNVLEWMCIVKESVEMEFKPQVNNVILVQTMEKLVIAVQLDVPL
jgi:hypothetical protein